MGGGLAPIVAGIIMGMQLGMQISFLFYAIPAVVAALAAFMFVKRETEGKSFGQLVQETTIAGHWHCDAVGPGTKEQRNPHSFPLHPASECCRSTLLHARRQHQDIECVSLVRFAGAISLSFLVSKTPSLSKVERTGLYHLP